jgi:hypothetical protein
MVPKMWEMKYVKYSEKGKTGVIIGGKETELSTNSGVQQKEAKTRCVRGKGKVVPVLN